jgi:transposase
MDLLVNGVKLCYNETMKNDVKTVDFSAMSREEIEAYAMRLSLEKEKLAYELAWYQEQFRLSRANRFGASSEQMPLEQISLFNEAETESYGKILPEPDLTQVKPRKKQKGHKEKLTKDLPKETIEYRLTEEQMSCPVCESPLHEMKKEIRKELKVIPAQVMVTEHVQYVYACRNCQDTGIDKTPIIYAPMPKPALENSLASPSMLAYVMSRKYADAMPLYRQEQQFQKSGLNLSRQTLANWMVKASEKHLSLLYDLMHKELVKKDVLHADETVLEVLREPRREAGTNSYMWLYRTSGGSVPIVLYEYTQGRSGDYAKAFLKGFRGYLQTDGYAGYHKLSESPNGEPPGVIQVGCFAHARRKYVDAKKAISTKETLTSANIDKGLSYCNRLFLIESKCKEMSPKERYDYRKKEATPVVDEYFAWVKSMEDKVLPKSKLGDAIIYSVRQEKYLRNYLLDGRLEISNNRAERSIKPFVIGRKNWLFSNTEKGATASAVIYSIIETAKENNLIPFQYLEYLFHQLPNVDRNDSAALAQLLPWSGTLPESCRSQANTKDSTTCAN